MFTINNVFQKPGQIRVFSSYRFYHMKKLCQHLLKKDYRIWNNFFLYEYKSMKRDIKSKFFPFYCLPSHDCSTKFYCMTMDVWSFIPNSKDYWTSSDSQDPNNDSCRWTKDNQIWQAINYKQFWYNSGFFNTCQVSIHQVHMRVDKASYRM